MELPDPPEGWKLTHLIDIGECWQANISSTDCVITASGSTPRYALLTAIERIGDERFERVKVSATREKFDLVAALGIKPKKERIGGF
jgi:hypothetical protein